MPSYLLQVSYNAEAWAAMIKKPQDRIEAVRKSIEKLGGSITGGWLANRAGPAVTAVGDPGWPGASRNN